MKNVIAEHIQDVKPPLPPIEIVRKEQARTQNDPFRQIERIERIIPFYKIISRQDYPCWRYTSLKKGHKSSAVWALKKQLSMLGFPLSVNDFFDQELEVSLLKFQKQTGLVCDGRVTKRLWAILHQRNRLKSLEKVLLKWKQMSPYMKGRFVFINIPKYKLYALENNTLAFTQRVIIGKTSRKTPEFFPTWMTHIVLNPSWTLPPTILLQDKLKKIKSDPGYLDRQGYIVRDQYGNHMNPYKINWHHISKHYMPYTIKLPPSHSNPLGDIKFHLSNAKAIFMHGTPDDHLFSKKYRALSSGCIRVEDEYELASWLRYGKVCDDTIQAIVKKVDLGNTTYLALKKSIPVFVAYIDTWVDVNYKIKTITGPYYKKKVLLST
jgi:murein L,D-transpeptidase YcbB/YkuD